MGRVGGEGEETGRMRQKERVWKEKGEEGGTGDRENEGRKRESREREWGQRGEGKKRRGE